jgi:Fe-S-cluster formation regulator IscX/YfhJ
MDYRGIDAEARGKVRMFKQKLDKDYVAIRAFYTTALDTEFVRDFVLKKGKGRQRVFDRINQFLLAHRARPAALRLDGKKPMAAWAFLRPCEAVLADPEDPRDTQDAVSVNYLFIGWAPHRPGFIFKYANLWSLEVTDHTLGRYFQRTRDNDLSTAIFRLHDGILNINQDDLTMKPDDPFHIRIGEHTWCAELRVTNDDKDECGEKLVHAIVRTYMDFDSLSPRREIKLVVPKPQAVGSRLGDHLLMLPPFRRLDKQRGVLVYNNLPTLLNLGAAS